MNDDYPSCERTKAVFRIHCRTNTPASISTLLNIEPSDTVEVGVAKTLPSGKIGAIGAVNLWMLDSENHVESKDLRRHLDWLLNEIKPAASRIGELREAGVVMDIWCVWWSSTGDGGPTIWPDQMRQIAELDLELSIGFSSFADE
jgi:hypothetical protein